MKDYRSFEYLDFIQSHIQQNTSADYFVATEKTFEIINNPRIPYRNFFYGVGIVTGGSARFTVGTAEYAIGPDTLIVIGPGILRQWQEGYETLEQTVFFFNEKLFQEDFTRQIPLQFEYFEHGAVHCFGVDASTRNRFFEFIRLIESSQPSWVPGLAFSLLKFIESFCPRPQTNFLSAQTNRPANLAQAFKHLLNRHYLEFKAVSFYADQMNISPKYLSEVVKSQTGKSPKVWIMEFVLNEAKSLLTQTDMSIKEIGFILGFNSTSHFIKQFKQAESLTPAQYRATHQ
jgi:AraC family transcriptional regulator, transcriptional activator of pobA